MSRAVIHSLVWFHIYRLTLTVEAVTMAKVTLDQGILVGGQAVTTSSYKYTEFLQIPYAKPPVGDLRFKTPQPPEPWHGERIATSVDKNKISYQFDDIKQVMVGSEDCLYLNVYTPALVREHSEPLAVMVYIHGGGFVIGNGIIKDDNGPDFLIEHEVIVVTINYRLGAYGFLSLDIPEAAGNMGLKDQIMALKWVQNNIMNFGGDKDNVTVFGISAGSASIEYLMLSPQSKGLFHKAILQSGSSLNQWAINYDIKDLSIKVAQELGFQGSNSDDRGMYEHLIGQPSEVLGAVAFNVSNILNYSGTYFGFVPSIEKDFGNGEEFLTEYPYILLKEGRFNKVPVIKGFCDSEGYLFLALKPSEFDTFLEKRNYIDYWRYPLNPNDADNLREKFENLYYKQDADNYTNERLTVDFFGDYDFTSGIIKSTELMVDNQVPVYAYMFTYDGNLSFLKRKFSIDKKGAAHGDDSMYVMGAVVEPVEEHEINPTKTDILIRNRLTTMFSTFAKTGKPISSQTELLPLQWPLYNVNEQSYLVIDEEFSIRSAYEPEKISLFSEIYDKYHK